MPSVPLWPVPQVLMEDRTMILRAQDLSSILSLHTYSEEKNLYKILSFSKDPAARTQQLPIHNPCW